MTIAACAQENAAWNARAAITSAFCVTLVAIAAVTALLLGNSAHAQPKPRVAVSAFENKVKTPIPDASWKIGEGLAEILTTELVRSGQFIVVERQSVADVVGEQALGQSGLIRRETAAPTGQMLGAQYTIRGAITEFDEAASGGGAGIQTRNLALEGRKQNAHVAIDLRLIDNASGQIVASHNISKAAPAAGGALSVQGRNVMFGGDVFYQTPIGQATRAAIQEALQFVVARTPRLSGPRSFSVVKVEGTTAYINAGANANVRVGDILQVFSRNEELTDPETGLKLGAVERAIGSIQVREVQEQFSVGIIQNATAVMRRGDSIRMR